MMEKIVRTFMYIGLTIIVVVNVTMMILGKTLAEGLFSELWIIGLVVWSSNMLTLCICGRTTLREQIVSVGTPPLTGLALLLTYYYGYMAMCVLGVLPAAVFILERLIDRQSAKTL